MIEEQARVLAVRAGTATLAVERQTACGSCNASGGCGTALLANWFPNRQLTLRVDVSIDVVPGDIVVVGLDDGLLQRFALRLYALPLFGLLGGALAGQSLGAQLGLSTELASIILGLFGLTAALVSIRRSRVGAGDGDDNGVKLLRVVRHSATPRVTVGLPVNALTERELK